MTASDPFACWLVIEWHVKRVPRDWGPVPYMLSAEERWREAEKRLSGEWLLASPRRASPVPDHVLLAVFAATRRILTLLWPAWEPPQIAPVPRKPV